MTQVPAALAAWVLLAGPTALLDVVRQRARRGQRTESGSLTTLDLTAAQRREVGLLLGTKWVVSGRPVRLQDVAARLVEHELSVRELVELIDGPIDADRDLRNAAAEAAKAERAAALAALLAAGISEQAASIWLADAGLPRRGNGELFDAVQQVVDVWLSLPQRGQPPLRLAQVATRLFNDAHALDADQALGRAVARLAAVVHGLPRPQRAGRPWRQAWAAVDVLCDEVSSRVLVLNLPLAGEAHIARVCRESFGDPVWISLRSLTGDWSAATPSVVFVCENPTVVEAAADALGRDCPPVVCTDGIATSAALDLVAGLVAGGCSLRIRADFDDAGLVIIGQLLSVAPAAELWRFDAKTYLTSIRSEDAMGDSAGLSVPNALDELRTAQGERGIAVHEEALLDDLLDDLRQSASAHSGQRG